MFLCHIAGCYLISDIVVRFHKTPAKQTNKLIKELVAFSHKCFNTYQCMNRNHIDLKKKMNLFRHILEQGEDDDFILC